MKFQEGELEFDFSSARTAESLDQAMMKCEGMKSVDFFVEDDVAAFLIEIKDPSQDKAPAHARGSFIKRIQSGGLINDELTPKARDSYTFLHLMRRDSRDLILIVFLGVDQLPHDAALLLNIKERLLKRIRQEADEPWKRSYVKDCIVVTETSWKKHFPRYPFRRIP